MTKTQLVQEISRHCGLVESARMSTGASEPGWLFDHINDTFGLGLDTKRLTKPETAAAIVEAAGHSWSPTFESVGGRVTSLGLQAVLRAVRFFDSATPDR